MALSDLTVRQAKATGKTLHPLRQRLPGPDGLCYRRQVVASSAITGWASKSACPWAAIPPSACARPAPSGTRPKPCSPGGSIPKSNATSGGMRPSWRRIHLQERLRCLGRASPQGTQGRPSEHALADPAHLQQGRAAHPWEDVDLRHSPPPTPGRPGKIEKRKAFTTAEKVRTWFNQLFRYALVIAEGLEVNPAADLDVVAEPKPPVAHNPYLHLPELPEFLQKLRLYNPVAGRPSLASGCCS
jgi:hypothetical protein